MSTSDLTFIVENNVSSDTPDDLFITAYEGDWQVASGWLYQEGQVMYSMYFIDVSKSSVSGTVAFNSLFDKLEQYSPIDGIHVTWHDILPDDLNSFNAALNKEQDLLSAANYTFMGKMAKQKGFVPSRIETYAPFPLKAYPCVEAYFTRP